MTVELDGMAYTATFIEGSHFRSRDLIVGDPIEAAVNGDNLIVTRPDGKTEKAKIVRKERIKGEAKDRQ